ncbi:lipase family protein [Pseudoxanthomonas sacheonensis]|uniref:lipase family protein n=1 Tax=Pseudoxanthomonas sacheonensis TaxID=443615 RepID=UPI0013CFE303|nr:lipase family protein [Pseudoxanthomonas sacheonensis]KAF1707087.1 lipase [Pseudoxanthomonas sacheonensis]
MAANIASPTQPTLDTALTLALAIASKAAYNYYSGDPITPPDGYTQMDGWTGWDAFLDTGSEEKYGLVFQSQTDPGTFIFAFRGTDSDLDGWEDVHFLTTGFEPSQGGISPTPRVASGFYGIYDGMGGGMAQSMRQQLFSLLGKYKPQQLYVTGHSLGAALSQLFSLDMAISQPTASTNINFASPMVGTDSWQTAYDATIAAGNSIRVYNYWDYVPTLPPDAFGYGTVGEGFVTSFYVKGEWFPHELSRHSIVNLTTVLSNALPLNPQQWAGEFPDYVDANWTMESTVPPATAPVRWVEKIGQHMAFERSLRAAAA